MRKRGWFACLLCLVGGTCQWISFPGAVRPVAAVPEPSLVAPFLHAAEEATSLAAGLPVYICKEDDDGFLIIGAGMSGLAAAHHLHASTKGCPITVLEASDGPGGRVKTIRDQGPFDGCEAGAGWIHGQLDNPLVAIAQNLSIATKWVGGDSSYIGGDQIHLYDGSFTV